MTAPLIAAISGRFSLVAVLANICVAPVISRSPPGHRRGGVVPDLAGGGRTAAPLQRARAVVAADGGRHGGGDARCGASRPLRLELDCSPSGRRRWRRRCSGGKRWFRLTAAWGRAVRTGLSLSGLVGLAVTPSTGERDTARAAPGSRRGGPARRTRGGGHPAGRPCCCGYRRCSGEPVAGRGGVQLRTRRTAQLLAVRR